MKLVTACTLDCPDGCSFVVEVENGQVTSVSGNPAHPFTAGFICAKTMRFAERLYSPDRITTPLLRVGSSWESISWSRALGLCAERIQAYRGEPQSIVHIQGGADAGMLSRISRLFFARLGAVDAAGSLCNSAGTTACLADFGTLDTNEATDMFHAQWLVNWGKDLARSSIHTAAVVRKARQNGTHVCTVSAGGDGNRGFSDVVITIRPGTDRFLAAVLIRLLLERAQVPCDILARTTNWDVFHQCVLSRSVADACAICGVSAADIDALYEIYARPEPVATLIGWGLQRHPYGGENVRYINALALLTGHVGQSGGGSTFTFPQARSFNLSWMSDHAQPPQDDILMPTIGRDITQSQRPPVKMIWVNASNVVNQAPDSEEIARAFATTEFKVVVDAFMNDTATRADLILPCALMLEKEDLAASNLHNYVNYVRPVATPHGEARTDYQILSELGRLLDPPVVLPDIEDCLRATLDSPYLDVTLEELRERDFAPAKRAAVAFADLRFAHPDGKYHLPTALHDEPAPVPEYPLRLLTLVRKEAIHSQLTLEQHDPVPRVWVSPQNPLLPSLDPERAVFLVSPLGRLQVALNLDPLLQPEVVVYRRGDWMKYGGGINRLIEAGLTDIGEGAPYYRQYVRLEN